MAQGNQTLAQALAKKLAHLRRAEVIAVAGDSSCTIDFGDGEPLAGVPALIPPEPGALVHVLVQGGANLILGTTNAATGGGGGSGTEEVFWQGEPPVAPLEGDLWIDSDAGIIDGTTTYFPVFVFDGLDWSPLGSPPTEGGGSGGGTVGDWLWSDSLVISAPGDGNIRGNSSSLAACTSLAVSKVTASGQIIEGYGTGIGDVLYLVNGPRTFGALFVVTSLSIQGTWIQYGVEFARGVSGDPVDREDVFVSWTPQAPTADHAHDEYLTPDEILAGTGITVTKPGDGTVEISETAEGAANAVYKFDAGISPGPAVGYLRFNNVVISTATLLYVNDVDAQGTNWSWVWAALTIGDEIMVVDAATESFFRGYVTDTVTDDLTSAVIPIALVAAAGVRPNTDDLLAVKVYLGSAESLDHGALGGLGDNDHPQYALTTDPGLDEVFYQPSPPAPGKAAVWVDSDGATGVAPIVSAIPVGGVIHHAGTQVPPEWLLCDGRAVSRTTFAVLYSVIGTTYGPGNNTSTFNLPNLIAKFARGNTSPGGTGGAASHIHPGTDWRTGTTDAAPNGTGNGNGAPDGTGSTNAAPDGTATNGDHNHTGTDSASTSHSHGIGNAGGHGHDTGYASGSRSASSGSAMDAAILNHVHNVQSAGSHDHGGTNSAGGNHSHSIPTRGDHSHGIPGSAHSHTVPNSVHTHGVPGSSHDHNVPASTDQNHLPPYLNLLPIMYAGV